MGGGDVSLAPPPPFPFHGYLFCFAGWCDLSVRRTALSLRGLAWEIGLHLEILCFESAGLLNDFVHEAVRWLHVLITLLLGQVTFG